jgi:hypothetical protein
VLLLFQLLFHSPVLGESGIKTQIVEGKNKPGKLSNSKMTRDIFTISLMENIISGSL